MIKQFFKKVLISYLIIICCIFTPTYNVYAASPSGWGLTKYDIAKSLLTATKNGVTVAVSAAPSASTIGSYAIRFAGAAAIAYAVAKYGGTAIDWVLDPANNSVRSKDGAIAGLGGQEFCSNGQCFATPELAGAVACGGAGLDYVRDKPPYYPQFGATVVCKGGELMHIDFKNTNSKTVGADEIGADLLSKAKSGDTSAASVVNGAIGEQVNKGTYDTSLNAAAAQQAADNEAHACGTGTHWSGSACVADTPATPSTPTDTPFDPSSILDAIASLFDAVMSLPDVINNALDDLLVDIKDFFQPVIDFFTDFVDWVKTTYDEFVKPGDNEPTQLDIPNNVPTPTDTNIRFGGMCPPNAEINVRIPYLTINATLFDWSKWCYNLETFVKPVIILLAAYFSILIFRGKNESS